MRLALAMILLLVSNPAVGQEATSPSTDKRQAALTSTTTEREAGASASYNSQNAAPLPTSSSEESGEEARLAVESATKFIPTTQVSSYWSHIALADGLAASAALVGVVLGLACVMGSWDNGNTNSPLCIGGYGFLLSGVAGYLLAPPIVHVYHDNVGGALESFALRLGLPALGYAIPIRSPGSRLLLMLGAIASAMILDGMLLAKTTRQLPEPAPALGRPFLTIDQHGATVGLHGLF